MEYRKPVFLVVGLLVSVGAVSALYFARKAADGRRSANTNEIQKPSAAPTNSPSPLDPVVTGGPGSKTGDLPTSFLGSLAPGGSTESAGRERTYVVTYEVAFFRKTPSEKAPEE